VKVWTGFNWLRVALNDVCSKVLTNTSTSDSEGHALSMGL
jgi:hypothetical protein